MANKTFNLTAAVCKRLPGPPSGSTSKSIEYTDELTRVKFVVTQTGRRFWYLRYTYKGMKRAMPLGEFPGISVEEARELAIQYRAMLDRGFDPQSKKDLQKKIPTFGEFALKKYMPYAIEHKRSADMDESKLRLHILKKFNDRLLSDITRYDIEMYLTEIAKRLSPATRNRHYALLSRMFNLAIDWECGIERNPCNGIKKLRESTDVGRALKPDEVNRLEMALKADDNQLGGKACLLLMYSGLRHAEVLTCRWEHVDFDNGTLFLPHTKSGRSRYVTLNPDAITLLKSIKRYPGSPWVFPGKDPKKPMNNIRKLWIRALKAAKVKHARIHDLRHSFASAAASGGISLYTIQRMLGHQSSQTTQRYAHLTDANAMREASAAAMSKLRSLPR